MINLRIVAVNVPLEFLQDSTYNQRTVVDVLCNGVASQITNAVAVYAAALTLSTKVLIVKLINCVAL